jgi:hypothetical protein
MGWQISSVHSGSPGWLLGQGKSTMPQEASLRWVGAPGSAREERGKPVRSGDGEPVAEIVAGAVTSLPTDRKPGGLDNMQGGAPFIHLRMERGDGTARA